MQKKYFHNFNGVRFYLALLIIFHHIEEVKSVLHLPGIFHDFNFFMPMGTSAVTMFFTLSGFLISYFLFIEKDANAESKINLRKFYRSRIVRIWPLYFLCVFLYWIVAPNSFLHNIFNQIYFTKVFPTLHEIVLSKSIYFILFMVLLPQLAGAVAYTFGGMAVYGGHLWSIGSEELFYLFWPVMVNKIKNYKKMFKMGFIVVYACFVFVLLLFFLNRFIFKNVYISNLILSLLTFLYLTRLYCMLIGALFAYWYVSNHRYVIKLRSKPVVITTCILFVVMIVGGIELPVIVHEIYAILSAIILLYLAGDDVQFRWLENKTVSYLGSITYGVYLYHIIVIIFFVYLAQILQIKHLLWFNLFVYIFSYIFSFLLAHFSYKYYEVKFLRFKK